MRLVDEDAALLTWRNEVKVDDEADPAIEGDPVQDKVELVLDEEEDAQGGPVHEPWGKKARVGGAEGFVGEEDGQEDGEEGAARVC